MNRILSYIITLSLVVIVILMLIRNKREINAQIAFAEKKVMAYPVRVTEVTHGRLDTFLEASGILSAREDLMLMGETQGRIEHIYVKVGDWVSKGALVAQVNDELMQAELMVTEANYNKASKDLQRARTLSEGEAITQQQLEGLQLSERAALAKFQVAKKRLADTKIKAPVAGFVNRLFVKNGGMLGPGVPVCDLVNTKTLKMVLKLDESEVVKVYEGLSADVHVDALQDSSLLGKVVSIGAKADFALQYEVEIEIAENPGQQLKAGMVAKAIFHFPDLQPGPVIPLSALIASTKEPRVFVVKESLAMERPISIGEIRNDRVKVTSGIDEGELLVTSGQFNLRDNTMVRIVD